MAGSRLGLATRHPSSPFDFGKRAHGVRRKMRSVRTWGPGLLMVSPSILLIGFFVYGLIGWSANISTTNQNSRFERAAGTSPDAHIGLANYTTCLLYTSDAADAEDSV